ncbi:MAG: hypothetical protein ACJ8GN_18365 [Longimicrobiaceae bacterium]
MSDALFVLGAVVFIGASLVQMLVWHPRSVQYRTDLRPGQSAGEGASWFWQVNVFDPRNYRSEAGRRFYPKLLITACIQLVGIGLMGLAFVFFDSQS